ncbi:MAG: M14 family zinc carboxypeptidase [Thermoanaerobaculia bacterium]
MRSFRTTAAVLLAAVPAGLHAAPSSEALWNAWPRARVYTGDPFALRNASLRAELARLAERHPGLFRVAEEGVSSEGRPIPLLLAGEGPTTVLLWSQMHGDEPTATVALLDVLNHLGATRSSTETKVLLSNLTLAVIPMLNPDGVERTRRTNAQGIDVNRDALRLQTPEGRFLKSVRDRLKPAFGYNLHNQSPNTLAGPSGAQAAISLLAVPFDEAFTENESRRTTKRLAVLVRELLKPWAPGRVSRYDMEYTARAFGDSMTRWGTATLLIESGGFASAGAEEAAALVRLNFVALLGTLSALADGSIAGVDAALYDAIPLNERDRLFDVVVRHALVIGGGGLPPYLADVGWNEPLTRPGFTGPAVGRLRRGAVLEIGDLDTFRGKTEIDATNRILCVAPPGGADGWAKVLETLGANGLATPDGMLLLKPSALSETAKSWLASGSALAPGYGGDFLLLAPAGDGRFRVERRLSVAHP